MPGKPRLTREQIAQRAALELLDGAYVNLGWGIPNLIADYLPIQITVTSTAKRDSGNGPRAKPGEEDFDLVDAMKVPVTLISGASFFHQADAHLMSRGGHLDVAVLGGFQVIGERRSGKLENSRRERFRRAIGGAMDIAAGAKTLIVCMEHTTKDGAPKIVKQCTYPLTGLACVDTIVTDLAVIDVKPEGLILREVARGWSAEEVQSLTGAPLITRHQVPEMSFA